MKEQFNLALKEEINSSVGPVTKKLYKMLEKELNIAISKRYPLFKDHIFNKIRDHNIKRRKWAIAKLKEIKQRFNCT